MGFIGLLWIIIKAFQFRASLGDRFYQILGVILYMS